MNREELIDFIIKHDKSASRKKLEKISLEALFLIYIQVEIKIANRKETKTNLKY